MRREVFERLRKAISEQERCVLFTVLDVEPEVDLESLQATAPLSEQGQVFKRGSQLFVADTGETLGDAPSELAERAPELIRAARNGSFEPADGVRVLAEVYGPPPRLVVYGAVDLAEALCQLARVLGWRTVVADARPRFTTRERLPTADQLVVAWPVEAFEQIGLDAWTAVVVLTHDQKFDLPALESALASDAFYVGALGSRRNQERRRGRLLELGVSEEAIDRIAGPCGLDIGAESQPETALSIFGEILAARAGREGGRLKQSPHRIHAVA